MKVDVDNRIWITNKEIEPKLGKVWDISRYGKHSLLLRINTFDGSGDHLEVFKLIGNFDIEHISRNGRLAIFETKPEAEEYYNNL